MKTKYLSLLATVCVCVAWMGCKKTPKEVTPMPTRQVRLSGEAVSNLPEAAGRVPLGGVPILGDEPMLGRPFYREGAFTEKGVKALQERLVEQEKRALEMAEYAGEELWVIYRPERQAAQDDHYPGTGA